MQIDYDWIVFFSRSGSEIFNIMNHFGIKPAAIITNRQDDKGIDACLKALKDKGELNWITLPERPEVKDYKKALKGFTNPLITLHGYLRILPEAICKKYTIYNLHPGLVNVHPELKGKDPQVRAVRAGHSIAGAVIHKVIPAVDEGKIVAHHAINIQGLTEEQVLLELHSLGSIMWYQFLKTYDHSTTTKPKRSRSHRTRLS